MLVDRFDVKLSTKKRKKGKRVNDPPHSDDLAQLAEYIPGLEITTRRRAAAHAVLDTLDVVKAFKLLEYQLLSGTPVDREKLDALNLGQYKVNFDSATDSLQTLLISVEKITPEQAKHVYVYLLTLICIY